MFEFDPFDPAYFGDPYPYYAIMRNEHPAHRREIPNHRVWPHYWMLSRAADVDDPDGDVADQFGVQPGLDHAGSEFVAGDLSGQR